MNKVYDEQCAQRWRGAVQEVHAAAVAGDSTPAAVVPALRQLSAWSRADDTALQATVIKMQERAMQSSQREWEQWVRKKDANVLRVPMVDATVVDALRGSAHGKRVLDLCLATTTADDVASHHRRGGDDDDEGSGSGDDSGGGRRRAVVSVDRVRRQASARSSAVTALLTGSTRAVVTNDVDKERSAALRAAVRQLQRKLDVGSVLYKERLAELFDGWLDYKRVVYEAGRVLKALRPTSQRFAVAVGQALHAVSPGLIDNWRSWVAAATPSAPRLRRTATYTPDHRDVEALAAKWRSRFCGPIDACSDEALRRRAVARNAARELQASLWASEKLQEPDAVQDAHRTQLELAHHRVRHACSVPQLAFRQSFDSGAAVRAVSVLEPTNGRENRDIECNAVIAVGDVVWDRRSGIWRDVVAIDGYVPQLLLVDSARVRCRKPTSAAAAKAAPMLPGGGTDVARRQRFSSWHPFTVEPAVSSPRSDDWPALRRDDAAAEAARLATQAWVSVASLVAAGAVVLRASTLDKPASDRVVFAMPKPLPVVGLQQLKSLLRQQRSVH